MFFLFAAVSLSAVSFAAPLPLPMPTGTLCGPNANVQVVAGPTFYDGDTDWFAQVECTDEPSCLAAVRRLDDPRAALLQDREARGERGNDVPTGAFVSLSCEGEPDRYLWTCGTAGCALTTTRTLPGVRWTSLPFDTLPGRPDRTVSELVQLSDTTLGSRATTQLADVLKGTVRRMDAALGRCAEGVPCDAGWETTRALTAPFLTEGRAAFGSFDRGMWGQQGFEATYTSLSDPTARATLSCYFVEGGCDWSAATCAVSFGPADAPNATFTANDDTTRWGEASFGLARWDAELPTTLTRSEGWLPAAPVAGSVQTAVR